MANPFDKAIAAIREHGWTQHDFVDDDEGVCTLGALGMNGWDDKEGWSEAQQAIFHLERTLRELGYPFVEGVWRWNDAPERTEEDVVLALKHAAVTWPGDQ